MNTDIKVIIDNVLKLAKEGFYVFPLKEGKKTPAFTGWQNMATTDENKIKQWWTEKNYNIGIYTGKFKDGSLLVVDVDVKNGKNGEFTYFDLEIEGFEFPPTRTHLTPTGGRHVIYSVKHAVKQGADVLGSGLDIRSRGGYIVAPGTSIDDKYYSVLENEQSINPAPEWLIDRCGISSVEKSDNSLKSRTSNDSAIQACVYLEHAPIAIQHEGGDQTTYQVACAIKDMGYTEIECFYFLSSFWNEHCQPPWNIEELKTKVRNAYKYGQDPVGIFCPDFSQVEFEENDKSSIEKLNQEYAFVLAGGGHHILWETKDAKNKQMVVHLLESSFHKYHAAQTFLQDNGKEKPLTEIWMRDKNRRTYKGICFLPGKETPKGWYNLWQGFSVDKTSLKNPKAAETALEDLLEHSEINICQGDKSLHHWLMGFFAHMVQRPWEKPLTALVFKGAKGVGKNALVDRIGHLLGNHYLLTAESEHVIGRFNAHLERALLLVLDEALWAGEKNADGRLKNLITGSSHNVEYKGKEMYQVDNCTRVIVMGNEDWLVPASHDERRFSVFNVGKGRQKQRKFFKDMRLGMEAGGYYLLLEYLLNYDISDIDVDCAPDTEGLLEQKIASLNPMQEWWYDSISTGVIAGYMYQNDGWPSTVPKEQLRESFNRYSKDRHIKTRSPTANAFGRGLKNCVLSLITDLKHKEESQWIPAYGLPSLQKCREEWEKIIGHKIQWEII